MNPNWYRNGWCHKVTALGIIISYFLLLIFIHDTTYIWATLALIFVLFVTTFSCASYESPFLTQLRSQRAVGITALTQEHSDTNQEQIQSEARIWMTDIPPSYSFVMSDLPPPTPPPSYGSAILMFPPPYVAIATKNDQDVNEKAISSEGWQLRRPLSFSTQMSVSGGVSETVQGGGISFSTQVSVIGGNHTEISPDLAVRARFYISREDSREEGNEENNTPRTERIIKEAQSRLSLLSRQTSREDSVERQRQDTNKYDKRFVATCPSRQLSKNEGHEEIDLPRQIIKQDLRRRAIFSTQVSRDNVVNNYDERDLSHNDRISSRLVSEEAEANNSDEKNGEEWTEIRLSRQNSKNKTELETQESVEIVGNATVDQPSTSSIMFIKR